MEIFVAVITLRCSLDLNIFGHPHYDTYHDIARVHWHAFKLPDHSQLSVQCHFEICTEISDSTAGDGKGLNSCSQIPTVRTGFTVGHTALQLTI